VYQNNNLIIDGIIILVTPCRLLTADPAASAADWSRFGVAIEAKESTEGIFFRE